MLSRACLRPLRPATPVLCHAHYYQRLKLLPSRVQQAHLHASATRQKRKKKNSGQQLKEGDGETQDGSQDVGRSFDWSDMLPGRTDAQSPIAMTPQETPVAGKKASRKGRKRRARKTKDPETEDQETRDQETRDQETRDQETKEHGHEHEAIKGKKTPSEAKQEPSKGRTKNANAEGRERRVVRYREGRQRNLTAMEAESSGVRIRKHMSTGKEILGVRRGVRVPTQERSKRLAAMEKHSAKAGALGIAEAMSRMSTGTFARPLSEVLGSSSRQQSLDVVRTVSADDISFTPLEIPQPPVPGLSYGLDRVLFNPGVYHLQDERSRVYNFDPYLQKIMPVREFDFNALKRYIVSSQDRTLAEMAKKHGKKYVGSTSSMTGVLAHFHYLLSQWRTINLGHLSKDFPAPYDSFTRFNLAPNAIFLRWKDGTYAIDADKQYDSASILSMLGKSMEKLLTLPTEEFERYRKTSEGTVSESERSDPEAYQYSTLGDFMMRSQLDAHDPRLPGTGMFDLKTRAVVSIRHDVHRYEINSGYQIRQGRGEWYSFEREYYDMMRSTMLKYSLQARMGDMDGIFLAFHNVERIFGFQYISIPEMDRALHNAKGGRHLGDMEFKLSLKLLNEVLEKATKKFPDTSIRLHFETRQGTTPWMYIFARPVSEEEADRIQDTNKETAERIEREALGLDKVDTREMSPEWERIRDEIQQEMMRDGNGAKKVVEEEHIGRDTESSIEQDSAAIEEDDLEEEDGVEEEKTIEEDDLEEEDGVEEEKAIEEDDLEEEDGVEEEKAIEEDDLEEEDGVEEEKTIEEENVVEEENAFEEENALEEDNAHEEENAVAKENVEGDQAHEEDQGAEPEEETHRFVDDVVTMSILETSTNATSKAERLTGLSIASDSAAALEDRPVETPGAEDEVDGQHAPSKSVEEEGFDGPILAMTLTIRNKVNGRYVQCPPDLGPDMDWNVEYMLEEISTPKQAQRLYQACLKRRHKQYESALAKDDDDQDDEDSEHALNWYQRQLRKLSLEGRRWRQEQDEKDGSKEPVVFESLEQSKSVAAADANSSITDVGSYLDWLYEATGSEELAVEENGSKNTQDSSEVNDYLSWLYSGKAE